MAKQQFNRKQGRNDKRDNRAPAQLDTSLPDLPVRASTEKLRGKTEKQREYIAAIQTGDLVFSTGPAGTGKTYVAGAMAAEALRTKQVDQIIITRPAVEAGESLGFLPGELEEKFAPYIAAFRGVLNERLGAAHVDNLLKLGKIKAEPLAYMRGLTFRNAFVIMDEAQNATPKQMKLFLTRIGEGAKVIVNGDTDQIDIHGPSGLDDAIGRLSFIPSVRVVKFGVDDVVRSGLCQEIVQAYSQGPH